MGVEIVPISDGRIDSFRECLDAVARERRFIAFLEAPPLDEVRKFILAAIAKGTPQFVALDGDRVVGWCDVFRNEWEGFKHTGRLGMGVLREYRGQGIGRRLAERTITRAKEIGLERIDLEVYASNESAIALYKKLGFEIEGVKRKSRKLDGVYDDVVLMAMVF